MLTSGSSFARSSRLASHIARRAFGSDGPKRVVSGQNARLEILKGCDTLADAVGVTLGPRGRNVLIEQTYGGPKITKDGVTVAKSIEVEDGLQKLGVALIKQVASTASEASGDGTTTATVLARQIYKGGCQAVAAGMKPIEVLKGIQKATEHVAEYLNSHSTAVQRTEDIYHVAKVSANGDAKIGTLISEAMQRVGRDGTITVAESKTMDHSLQIVEGYQYDKGMIAPYFATDATAQKCEYENCYVLIADDKISDVQALLPILEQVVQTGLPLLIVAEDVDGEAIATLVLNRIRAGLKVCATRAPGFGEHRKNLLEDLAALTGGKVASKEYGAKLSKITLDDLGRVKKVVVHKDSTLMLEGNSDQKRLKQRIDSIKYQLEPKQRKELSEYEVTRLQERLGKLTGGVAVIQVGGVSEVEVGETKDRLDDALCATRAAVERGVLPGGGTALLFAAQSLKKLKGENMDQDTGIRIVKEACEEPIKLIAKNAGYEGAVVVGDLLREHKFGHGFDATCGEYKDMMKAGILDPTKVVSTAITNASSVAGIMTTTEAAVCSAPKKDTGIERGLPGNDDL